MAGIPDFLGAPIVETPEETFKRTGAPQIDPANQLPDFLGQEQTQPEIEPYNWTAAGVPLPKAFQPIGDAVAGLNQGLANAIGMPVDGVDALMRQLGMDGILDQPGGGRDAVVKAMESMGIGADKRKAANKFLGDMGEAGGENLVMLSAMLAAAPQMLAAQGSGGVATFVRDLGEALVKHPWLAASSEITAGAGGEAGGQIGQAIGGDTGEALGGIAGAFTGGLTPGVIANAVTSLPVLSGVKGIAQGIGEAFGTARAGMRGFGQAPLVSDTAPSLDLVAQAIKGDQMRVEGIIEKLTKRMTSGADPLESAEQLQAVQRAAMPVARRVEGDYWSKVDMKRPVNPTGLKGWGKALVDSTVKEGRSEWLPHDLLADIKALPKGAKIENLRAIRTKAFTRMQRGTVPTPQGELPLNDTLRSNLKGMIDAIDSEIAKAYPNDIELQKATGFSKWLHNRFTRGPVGQFARPRSSEDMLPDIEGAAKRAMRQKKFGPQTADIAEQLEMPALKVAAENFLRGQLEAEISKSGPDVAAKFMKLPSTKAFLRAYPDMAAQWAATGKRLNDMMLYRKEVLNSAFIKSASEQPATAIHNIFTARNRVANARQLMQRIGKNPEALEAAQNAMVMEVERMAKGNPQKILEILNGTDVRSAVSQIMGAEKTARLERIARDAVSYMDMKQDGIPRFIMRRGGKVIGGWLGRKLNTGTLQAPEFGGRLVQKMVDDWMGTVEDDIFSKAVRYPAWEAVLKAKAPTSISDMGRLQALVRRAIRVEEATERSMVPLQGLMEGEDE